MTEEKLNPEEAIKKAEETENEIAEKRKVELLEIEKRVDEKTQNLEKVRKEIEVSGKSIVEKQKSEDEKLNDEMKDFFKGSAIEGAFR